MDDYHFISSTKYGKIEKEEALNHIKKKTKYNCGMQSCIYFNSMVFLLLDKSNLHTQNLKVRSSFALQTSIDLLWKCEIREVFE